MNRSFRFSVSLWFFTLKGGGAGEWDQHSAIRSIRFLFRGLVVIKPTGSRPGALAIASGPFPFTSPLPGGLRGICF